MKPPPEQHHPAGPDRVARSEIEQLLQSMVDPIVSIDPDGVVLTANPAVERVFGWPPEDLVGRQVDELMGEPFWSEHDHYIETYLATGVARAIGTTRKALGRRRNGEDFACELSVSRVDDPSGPRFFAIVRDVSEREELADRLDQVERLAAIGELAAGVAHEVNNPVNTIINCAQLIKDGDRDPVLLDDIIQEGLRIATIVRDLLTFARDQREQHSPVRVEDVIRRSMSLIARRIERQGIRIDVEIEDGLPAIHGRSQQLQQVMLNLLLNARDALLASERPEPKRIRITARATAHAPDSAPQVELRVFDNGTGIQPSNEDRIFNPFFTDKRERGGTGLGLAVSRGIVEGHGGSLTARSVFGEFAEFLIALPAAPESGPAPEPAERNAALG